MAGKYRKWALKSKLKEHWVMIKSTWAGFLILVTILGIVVIYAPVFAIFTIVFPPLFLLLAIMPSIAMYSWAITVFLIIFRFMGKGRYIVAPAVVVILSLAIPYYYNLKIDDRIQELIKEDIAIKEQLPNGGILAFEIPISYSIRGAQDNKCQSLCQRLLYNKAYEQVMVKAHMWNEAYNFYIKNKQACPSYRQILDGVAVKIANGECLIEARGSTDHADFIYRNETVSYPDKKPKFKLNALTVRADRITVIDNRTAAKKVLYQKTKIESRPLAYPLIIGLGGGRELNFYAEIYRSKKKLNKPSQEYTKKIFGVSAIKKIEESSENKIKIISDYLQNRNKRNLEAVQLIKSYWIELDKKDSYSKEDINIITQLLNDDRVKLNYHFPKIIGRMKSVPDELVIALGKRVLHKPAYYVSQAIMALPEGRASVIAPQLEILARDPELRSLHWQALTRLSDGSDLSVDQYIDILRDYREVMNREYDRDSRKKIENAVSGAIKGLCRLGEDALPAKDLLYSILEAGDRWTKPSIYISVALLQIVDMSELEQKYLNNDKYKNNDRIGKEIKRAIQKKERAINAGISPC